MAPASLGPGLLPVTWSSSPPELLLTPCHEALPFCHPGTGPVGAAWDSGPGGHLEDGESPVWGPPFSLLLRSLPLATSTPDQPLSSVPTGGNGPPSQPIPEAPQPGTPSSLGGWSMRGELEGTVIVHDSPCPQLPPQLSLGFREPSRGLALLPGAQTSETRVGVAVGTQTPLCARSPGVRAGTSTEVWVYEEGLWRAGRVLNRPKCKLSNGSQLPLRGTLKTISLASRDSGTWARNVFWGKEELGREQSGFWTQLLTAGQAGLEACSKAHLDFVCLSFHNSSA